MASAYDQNYWERRAARKADFEAAGIAYPAFTTRDDANFNAAVASGDVDPAQLSEGARGYVGTSNNQGVLQSIQSPEAQSGVAPGAVASPSAEGALPTVNGQQIRPDQISSYIDQLMADPRGNEEKARELFQNMEKFGITDEQVAQHSQLTPETLASGRQTFEIPTPVPPTQGLDILPQEGQVRRAPQTGLIGSEQALAGGLEGGVQALQTGLGGFNQFAGQALGGFQPFAQTGQQANQLTGALSGAQGPEAQAQAYANFNQSPATQFLREQGEQGVMRNAAAMGGLGGGNVQKELSRFNQGLAQQDFGNYYNRLAQQGQQGFNAAGAMGNILGGQGQATLGTGQNIGNLIYGTGQQMAGGRTRAGEQIAGQIGNVANNLSNLANQQGLNLSGLTGQQGQQLAQLLQGFGQTGAGSQQSLAQLLANLSVGAGGQFAGLPGIPGTQQNQGMLGGLGSLAGGIGGLATGFGWG